MAMTREERNKRRSDLKFSNRRAVYENFKSQYIGLWQRGKKEKMTLAAILEHRKWIMETDAYKSLPGYYKERLTGISDVLFDLAYRNDLVFCYPDPDLGVIRDAKSLCDDGLASRLDNTKGNHYWKNDDGSFTHPF